ncbi:metal ABC transporter solute-binding protein, Zn/Mn family [Actinomyces howellii]|uniref:Probable zinc transport system zinc-binding lipoprotein AdcA n=1 Tax=Actinomyces howellii TaxID=52771 RepID=A0A3S4UW73_9ACTO|nr:zinc ABC transporter substrate-binding protein [Actinomyces howellii]VEG26529.1 Probable zinc transport system zinc-binding lipoprotein AdcA precursor [Actinomyces howellii]
MKLFSAPSRRPLAAAAAVALAGSLTACSALSSDSESSSSSSGGSGGSGTVSVAASFYPIQYLTEAVGGEHVTVTSVTPTNAEPHDFELSPKEVQDLSSVDLVTYVSGFQPSLDDALTQVSGPTVLDLADSVELTHHDGVVDDHDHGEEATDAHTDEATDAHTDEATDEHTDEHTDETLDPHFWLDPQRMILAAEAIEAALAEADPAHAADFEANLAAVRTAMEGIDQSYTQGLGQCERTTFVTAHSAFGYLAERYNLTQASISGLDPEHEPSPAELAAVKQVVESTGTTVIFTEELVSPETAQALASETGATTAVLNPIESAPQDGDYATAMETNLGELRTALACQ